MANKGYVGKIPNAGTMKVQAPHQTTPKKTGKMKTGKDLRTGKK